MATIQVRNDENIDKAISRFKKMVEKEGIITEYKKRRYFMKPSALKHDKKKSIQRRELKNQIKLKKKKQY